MARTPETSSSIALPQREAPATTPATPEPKVLLTPQAENFAFALRMLGLDSVTGHASPTLSAEPPAAASANNYDAPPAQPRGPITQPQSQNSSQSSSQNSSQAGRPESQASNDARHETQSSAPETQRPDASDRDVPHSVAAQQTAGVTPHWNEVAVLQASELGSQMSTSESAEAIRGNSPLIPQEAHLLAPELPKTSTSSEILLHLTGNDQSSAAIRVTDRAGEVNVSVHASDPVLRESLRSNLDDLSSQLNSQGWKADVVKAAAVATQSGSQQDSHEGGQRGSHQQSFGGDRQPQRDRRSHGGQWQQELDQQISGGDAPSGGNG
jgi:hypothetical protein